MNTLIVDAKSGTSGAGRGCKSAEPFCEVNENMKAYGVATSTDIHLRSRNNLDMRQGESADQLHATSGSDEQRNSGDGICNIEKDVFLRRSQSNL